MKILDNNIMDVRNYEFIDFGCSLGGSLRKYRKMFKVEGKGLGLDSNPEKVKRAIQEGFDAEVCDLIQLQFNGKVGFVIMHHFLEHLPNIYDVQSIIKKACHVAKSFVFIRQPYFDSDPYLFTQGFKFFWSNWSGHPNNMTMLELHNILFPMYNSGIIQGFSLYGLGPVFNSEDPALHNLDAEVNQHEWDPEKHSPKEFVKFNYPVFKEMVAVIDIRGKATKFIESKINYLEKFYTAKSKNLQD